ncbi:MAG: hydrogenase maturation nickel metallochaperone HypA [Syntrophomonadaceae bacterium]|nr:hydrogenase maturation nickel metallochaperone HypA [Syntrophomonadaceae bacterium]
MHELPFTKNILSIALKFAEKNKAKKVKAIYLRIGVLRDMQEDWLRRYFAYISKDTIAEEARLYVMPEPLILVCNNCGEQFGIDLQEFVDADEIACPACKQSDYYMESGTEFIIQSIEIE